MARTLQVLGADIEVEPDSEAGTRIDFLARFPDRTISVEAVAPVINAAAGEEAKRRNPLLDVIDSLAPPGGEAARRERSLLDDHAHPTTRYCRGCGSDRGLRRGPCRRGGACTLHRDVCLLLPGRTRHSERRHTYGLNSTSPECER